GNESLDRIPNGLVSNYRLSDILSAVKSDPNAEKLGKYIPPQFDTKNVSDQMKELTPSTGSVNGEIVNPEDVVKSVEPAGTGNVSKATAADIDLPEGQMERSYAKNVRTQRVEDVPDEVAAEFSDQPEIYNVLHNADTKDKAQKIFDQGMDSARNEFDKMLTEHDPAAIPLGHSIAKELSAQGNHDAAAEVLRRMSQELTKTGQFSQAAAITMMKDDPMTALSYIEKQMDALNREGLEKFGKKWKDFSLTDAEKAMFDKIEPGDSEAIARAFDEIGKRIGIEYPSTMMDKLLEARKVAMLFNVRTNVRNLLANMPTLGMRWTADRVEAVGQNIAHLINPDIKVTQSLTGSGVEGRQLAQKVFNSDRVKALLEGTSGKYEVPSLKSTITKNATMFKGSPVSHWIDDMTNGGIQKLNKTLFGKEGVRSGAETIRNATYKMLDLGDSPFVRENFVQRLGSYIKAQGIKNIEDVPDEAIQVAWEEAMKATYKDNSWAVQMLRGIRNDGIGKIPVVGRPLAQAAIPFLQAPGNIAARMVDYSPVRGTKGIADIIKGAHGADEKLIRRGIEEASKGLTGTGMLLLGMALHKEGILTGALSDDKDKAQFEKQTGKRPFALHVGDKYLTYDWAQPFAEPLLVGTLLSEAIKASDDYDSDLLRALGHEGTKAGKVIGGLKAGTSAAINSWFDESPLQGLQELMGGSAYSTGGIAENIGKVGVSNFLQSFVPAAVGATAKSLDPVQRQTYDPSNQIATQVNLVKSKIPGLSKTLPAKYDTWGREVKTGESSVEAFAARFLVPGDYSYDKESPIDQEIQRLYESLEGNNVQMFPQVAANKVGDKKLNNREVSELQKNMGERSYKFADSFIKSDAYKSMDDESKVVALQKLYGVSKAISERDLFDKPVADTYKKLVEAYDKNGEKGVIEYLIAKDAAKNEKGNITVQSVLDYAKANKDVSKETLEMMMPSNASGSLAKVNGKWVYKDKEGKVDKQSSDTPAEKTKTELQDYGITKNGAIASVEKAQTVIPGLTQKEAVNTYKKIDTNGNQGITQDELIGYLNKNNMSESEGKKYWNAYGNASWKKVPVLANGTWKKK
ncbi:MAG: hypothetical protein K6G16_06815, partial [Lachnospiraceae bacterium]|nr:hypothetical protein [Lachnospiraceae bacterium]